MTLDIQFLVERLEALVVNARKLPMTSQVIIEQATIVTASPSRLTSACPKGISKSPSGTSSSAP